MSQTLVSETPVASSRIITTPWYRTQRFRGIVEVIVVYALVLPGACMFVMPLLWMFSTALKPPDEIFVYPPQWMDSERILLDQFYRGVVGLSGLQPDAFQFVDNYHQ